MSFFLAAIYDNVSNFPCRTRLRTCFFFLFFFWGGSGGLGALVLELVGNTPFLLYET